MLTIDALAGPAPRDLARAGTDASRGCLDTSIERRPGHSRPVASWSAGARPVATCSVHARPTLALQRKLISRLVG
jgi:hypothetical protein